MIKTSILACIVAITPVGWGVGGANFWNPISWAILGVAIVATGIYVGNVIVHYYKEHVSTKNEKKKNKHQEGESRRKRDQGGEKKKQKPNWKRPR